MAGKRHTITLSDGEARQVRFTFGTLDRLREATGMELEDFHDKEKMTTLVTRNLPLFIWAALGKADRGRLTPEDLADLIDFEDLPAITADIFAAMGGGPEHPTAAAAMATAAANNSPSSDVGPSHELSGDYEIVTSGI